MPVVRLDTALPLLVAAGLLASLACEQTRRISAPDDLRTGRFRAHVDAGGQLSLTGEADFSFDTMAGPDSSRLAWVLSLEPPRGTGADSIAIRFMKAVSGKRLPGQGPHPIEMEERLSHERVFADVIVHPDSSVASEFFQVRSGTLTVTESEQGEVLAGQFRFGAEHTMDMDHRRDPVSDTIVEVAGSFRTDVPR